jgi:very-short-patch-repair endonuclease
MRREPPVINRRRARAMRGDSTLAENMLWQAARDRKLKGFKFSRQVPLKNYILDLVCFEAKLIVELEEPSMRKILATALETAFSQRRAFGFCVSGMTMSSRTSTAFV